MQITMKDRVAVVTGGSKGIGLAVARQFAECGAKVAIIARSAEGLAAARQSLANDGLAVRDYVCDVSRSPDISKAYEMICSDFGKVDILVNNAAVQFERKKFTDIKSPELLRTFKTNIISFFWMTKAALPHMKKGSCIINSSSVTALPSGSRRRTRIRCARGAQTSITAPPRAAPPGTPPAAPPPARRRP